MRRATTDDLIAAVHGVRAWAEVDDRFDEQATRMRGQLRALHGVDLTEAWEEQKGAEFVADLARSGLDEIRSDQVRSDEAVEAAALESGVASNELGYDAARDARGMAAVRRGAAPEDLHARVTADKLNAGDPSRTAAQTARRPALTA